ncbi:MAG: phosphoglucosamine mutase [Candidatus Aminicenantes bacterium]|nr:phosphoglucosamine mutase [Candidatus Aminicenantes bacterium]
MNQLFGTDGIRAVAGKFPLDYSTVWKIGKSLVHLLENTCQPAQILIGRDTRSSGEWIQKALFQGIKESNGKPVSAGIIPTSAVSILSQRKSFCSGVMISASHNPFEYNGIKIFSSNGLKINQSTEQQLEKQITQTKESITPVHFQPLVNENLRTEYIRFLKSKFTVNSVHRDIKIVLDCANGSSSSIAPHIFSELGFTSLSINSKPNGTNINSNCGSLYPESLSKRVIQEGADLGIAFDGDSDRAIFVDEKGSILNGDHTLFILSSFMKERGLLKSNKVIGTIISNLGLEIALKKNGLQLIRTNVGDKYVYEEMLKQGSNLGGEQSGHTIILDECRTGDGILTGLKTIQAMLSKNRPLSDLIKGFDEYPQVQKNVRVSRKQDFALFPEIMDSIRKAEQELGEKGRVNVRYSGTEPLARVMIEGDRKELIENLAQMISQSIDKELK